MRGGHWSPQREGERERERGMKEVNLGSANEMREIGKRSLNE